MKIPTHLLLLTFGLLPLATLGCTSTPDLTVTSISHNQCYRQGFTQAYTRKDSNGDTDVILVDSAAEEALNGKTSSAPVRQMMHIRIVWAPTSDMNAVVSNASVKWYVIGQSKPQDVLQYSGIAFVSMDGDANDITLKIRNATLRPADIHGKMVDPIGPATLEGKFTAHPDADKVTQALRELKTVLAEANAATKTALTAAPLN